MNNRTSIPAALTLCWLCTGTSLTAQTAQQRLRSAADVLSELMAFPDKAIPRDLLEKAQCIIVVPGIKKAASILSERHGQGFISCRGEALSGWSAPASVRLEVGSFGFQIGGFETDAVMLVMNKRGAEKVMSSGFTLGANTAVAAGPVGRVAEAGTDAQMHAEILTYARSDGAFAGVALEGATIRPDVEGNRELYGDATLTTRQILTGKVKSPVAARPMTAQLNKYSSGKTSSTKPTKPSHNTEFPPPPRVGPPPPNRPAALAPTWNTWMEESLDKVTFDPLTTVVPNSQYKLVIDLAAFSYGRHEGGVGAQPAGHRLVDWLKETKQSEMTLEAVLIPDPGYFLKTQVRAKPIAINLEHLRAYLSTEPVVPREPFASLKATPDPSFQFGRVSFIVNTGPVEGLGFLGVSMWAKGMIPFDEISIPVCISKTGKTDGCRRADLSSRSGGDPLNAAPLTSETDLPAAVFHFIEFDDTRGVGVFRRQDWTEGEYVTWSMNKLSAALGMFTGSLLKNFEKETSEEALAQTGSELYNLLVPANSAEAARSALEALAAERVKAVSAAWPPPPSAILVRIAPLDPANSFAVPLAMMTVPVDGTRRFIGDLFRIISPLPRQDYRPLQSCIARWVMVMPPDDPRSPAELLAARKEFNSWTNACKGSDCMSTLQAYADWIGSAKPEESNPTALLLLSHYENQSLTFDHTKYISSLAVSKPFAQPSIAIINACGAAAPGADALVQSLNSVGFQTVVATTTTVSPIMAGKYFNLLAQVLEDNRNVPDYTISRAHFDAVQRLKEQSLPHVGEKPFGAKALIYSLMGNGSLMLCPLSSAN